MSFRYNEFRCYDDYDDNYHNIEEQIRIKEEAEKEQIRIKEEAEKEQIRIKEEAEKEQTRIKEEQEYFNNLNQKELSYLDSYVSLNFFCNLNISKSNKYIKQEIARKKKIINIIAGINSFIEIKDVVIKKLLFDNLEYMIFTYAKKESLSSSFIHISKQNNCISILIKGILKNNHFVMDNNIMEEINKLEKEIYTNKNNLIVYDRVGIIQMFIHNKINEKYGKDAYLKLSAILMKNTLSSLRLHLNIYDIKKLGIKALINQIKQSEEVSLMEEKHPFKIKFDGTISLENSKKTRDIKSLIDFSYFNIAKKIYDISELKENIPIEIFKDRVIEIYTNLGFFPKKIKWI